LAGQSHDAEQLVDATSKDALRGPDHPTAVRELACGLGAAIFGMAALVRATFLTRAAFVAAFATAWGFLAGINLSAVASGNAAGTSDCAIGEAGPLTESVASAGGIQLIATRTAVPIRWSLI
jgi:hypothetical protein